MRWGRRLPDQLGAVVRLAPGERLLTWAPGCDPQGWAVASSWGLWTAARGRLPWDGIDRASWTPPVLSVIPAGGAPLQLRLPAPRDLPAVVRAQVSLAVVVSRRQVLRPGPGVVRVVALRSPQTSAVQVQVRYEQGADPAAAETLAAAAELRADVERDLGI